MRHAKASALVVSRAVEKLGVSVTRPTPRQEEERRRLALLERVAGHLESERPAAEMELTTDEERDLRQYGLLTMKPWLLLVSLPDQEPVAGSVRKALSSSTAASTNMVSSSTLSGIPLFSTRR